MTTRTHVALGGALVCALGLFGQAQTYSQDEALLRTAITREVVDGKPAEAMAILRKLVTSSNRAVAAEAETRLTALEAGQQSNQVQMRRLFAGTAGRPSRDGSLVPTTTNEVLELFDVKSGSARRVLPALKGRSESLTGAVISPGGGELVYGHSDFERGGAVWIVNSNGTGNRLLFHAEGSGDAWPVDWSADGRRVLVIHAKENGSRELLMITIPTGASSVLYSGNFGNAQFSAEGSFIFLQVLQNIFAIPTAGGAPRPLVDHQANDTMIGLAPDGRLAFTSDRSGVRGVWAVRVQNGETVGTPELIVADIGQQTPIGISQDGSLFYRRFTSSSEVYLVRLNEAGAVESGPTPIASRFVGANSAPDYSPDGRYLAYVTGPATTMVSEIRIRTLATGEERIVPKTLRTLPQLRWYPDGRSLLLVGNDGTGKGLHRLDLQTGTITLVTAERLLGGAALNPTFSADGRYLFFEDLAPGPPDSENVRLVRMDVNTGVREEVLLPPRGGLRLYALSPDGTRIAYNWRRDEQDFVYVRAVAGGEPTLVHEVPKDDWARAWGGLGWAADGRSIFFHRGVEGAGPRDDLIRIPATGGPAEKVLSTGMIQRIAVHPDGRQLAIHADINTSETFVMTGVFTRAR